MSEGSPWLRVVDAEGMEVAEAPAWELFGGRAEARVFRDWLAECVAQSQPLAVTWAQRGGGRGAVVRLEVADVARLCAAARHALDSGIGAEGLEPDMLDQIEAFVDIAERVRAHLERHAGHDAALGGS